MSALTKPIDAQPIIRICRDEDCPECGWPETFTEVDYGGRVLRCLAVGCRKCGWREPS